MADVVKEIAESILNLDRASIGGQVEAALAAGTDPETILNEAMISSMEEAGRRFENEEFFVPEMLLAAKTMKEGMTVLTPYLAEKNVKSLGKMVVGTVQGDLHDIGKNLVAIMAEGGGFEVDDLGVDVSAEKFVEAARGEGVRLVALSSLMTTTLPIMRGTIEALKEAGLLDKVRVIVGGAAVTEPFSQEIGAHGYAPDASRALRLAKSLITR
jgi:5-methyltetrahydrofolate--homocysteine methyltransferase